MAGRPSNRGGGGQPPVPPAAQRQNEYFVPRDGIDREVITSDICRYLGNDALVRPGTYESPDGRVTQGYFITAYRNLTSAMIQDLKADSARWEQERRAASRSSGGGAGGPREQTRGQSDYSAWKNRQREQEYEASYGASAMDIDYPQGPPPAKAPGYGGQPYPGAPPAGYPQAAYPPQVHPAAPPAQYQTQPYGGYPPNAPPTQYSPGPQGGDRYAGMAPPPPIQGQFAQDPAFIHGSNYQTAPGYANAPRMPAIPLTSSSAPPASRAFTAPTTGPPVFGETDPYGYPPPAGIPASQAFPVDPLYGRGAYNTTTITNPPEASSDDLGSPAGTAQRQGYPAAPDQPPYEDHNSPVIPNTTVPPTSSTPTQLSNAGPSGGRRDRDSEPRDRERDHREHRARRSEAERDDRHGDRNRHHRR
ncbi:hypothetical protein QBC40DRAFT_188675 [Triangularia verruculosa]|uniref:Transcription factor RfeG n=1 Tax=Triangularia verruculosa TaxID=2587418 RepID=A0AAN7AQS9_9PEZI|nr:hypothetical protein QBC40DRAFT_188675 [Triangularia verruculosa]